MTKLQAEYSRLINSQHICMVFNNDMDNVREELRRFCTDNNYQGGLLTAYNRTYQYTDKALAEYIDGTSPESHKMPKRFAIKFMDML